MNDVNRTVYYGLAAPKGMPVDIVDRIKKAVKQALAAPEVQKQITDRESSEAALKSSAGRLLSRTPFTRR